MKQQGKLHHFWFWSEDKLDDKYITFRGRELSAHEVLWTTYCKLRRKHEPIDDMCGKPEHRFCWICMSSTPNEPTVH